MRIIRPGALPLVLAGSTLELSARSGPSSGAVLIEASRLLDTPTVLVHHRHAVVVTNGLADPCGRREPPGVPGRHGRRVVLVELALQHHGLALRRVTRALRSVRGSFVLTPESRRLVPPGICVVPLRRGVLANRITRRLVVSTLGASRITAVADELHPSPPALVEAPAVPLVELPAPPLVPPTGTDTPPVVPPTEIPPELVPPPGIPRAQIPPTRLTRTTIPRAGIPSVETGTTLPAIDPGPAAGVNPPAPLGVNPPPLIASSEITPPPTVVPPVGVPPRRVPPVSLAPIRVPPISRLRVPPLRAPTVDIPPPRLAVPARRLVLPPERSRRRPTPPPPLIGSTGVIAPPLTGRTIRGPAALGPGIAPPEPLPLATFARNLPAPVVRFLRRVVVRPGSAATGRGPGVVVAPRLARGLLLRLEVTVPEGRRLDPLGPLRRGVAPLGLPVVGVELAVVVLELVEVDAADLPAAQAHGGGDGGGVEIGGLEPRVVQPARPVGVEGLLHLLVAAS